MALIKRHLQVAFCHRTPPEGGALLTGVQFRLLFEFYAGLTLLRVRVAWFKLCDAACGSPVLFWVWVVVQPSVHELTARSRPVGYLVMCLEGRVRL